MSQFSKSPQPGERPRTSGDPRHVADAPSVAVVGPGAVGLALGGWLAAAGSQITLCGRRGADPVSEIEMLDQDQTRVMPVTWHDQPSEHDSAAPVDIVVLATKLPHTGTASAWLGTLVGPQTVVLVAQNGVDHRQRLAQWVPPGRVIPALVYFNAYRRGPGKVEVKRNQHQLVIADDQHGGRLARLFAAVGVEVDLSADFTSASWHKLLVNAVANPITALTCRGVEVFTEPTMRSLAVTMLYEVAEVGRAEGATLSPSIAQEILTWLDALPPGTGSSMLEDRLAGRPLEHDDLLGTVFRLAQRHHLPAPACRTVLTLISALDVRRRLDPDS